MKKVLLAMSVAFMFLVVSCNKNQAAVKKLDGTWTATKMVVSEDGASFDLIAMGFVTSSKAQFDGCKLKKDEWCNVTFTTVTDFGTSTSANIYKVVDDGKTLQTKDSETSSTINSITIVELTKKVCKLKQVDGNTTTELEFTK